MDIQQRRADPFKLIALQTLNKIMVIALSILFHK